MLKGMQIGLTDGRTVIREPVSCIVRSVSTDRQTDRRTDELIWGGLGNLRFLQVHLLRVGWRNLVQVSLI